MNKVIGESEGVPERSRSLYREFVNRLLNRRPVPMMPASNEPGGNALCTNYLDRALARETSRAEDLSYSAPAFVYQFLTGVAHEFIRDRDEASFLSYLKLVSDSYSQSPNIRGTVDAWRRDLLLLGHSYSAWWSSGREAWLESKGPGYLAVADFVFIRPQCDQTWIDSVDLDRCSDMPHWRLRPNGNMRMDFLDPSLVDEINRRLLAHGEEAGANLIQSACGSTEAPVTNAERWRRGSPPVREVRLFKEKFQTGPELVLRLPDVTREACDRARSAVRKLVRECTNEARLKHGIPAIGEGWPSEALLFHLVQDAFPDLEVLHNARPDWLEPQHFDVYIPAATLAIEHQGRQHYEPVSIFGGEAAFKKNVRRDERKRALCAEHGVLLVEVSDDYDWESLKSQLERKLRERVQRLPSS